MNGNIECAFIGRLGQDTELKTSTAGNSGTRLLLDKVGCPVPAELRLIAVSTLVIECEDGIAPDKKLVIRRNASTGSS